MTTETRPPDAAPSRRRRRWPWILGGAIVALVVAVVGGTWVYINFIRDEAPERLTFENADAAATTTVPAAAATTVAPATTAAAATGDGVTGTWVATDASQLGYRVKEVLFGQSAEGVGRTNAVTGQIVIDGTTVSTASFEVDMTTLQSDEDRRDDAVNGRILETSQFPTATFTLTQPIELGSLPADRTEVTVQATGDLTLRGVTKPITTDLVARRNGAAIEVNGSIPIVFADWGIPNPSNGPITTEDNGLLEFLLVFNRS